MGFLEERQTCDVGQAFWSRHLFVFPHPFGALIYFGLQTTIAFVPFFWQ